MTPAHTSELSALASSRSGARASAVFFALACCIQFPAPLWSQATNLFPASGNVGIGTTIPSAKLTVIGDGGALFAPYNILQTARFKTGANGALVFDTGATGTYNLRALEFDYQGTSLAFGRYDSSSTNSPLYDMVVSGTGNVGIGTTSPGAKLELNVGANDGLRLNNGTVNGVVFNTSNVAMTVGTVSNHPLYLFTNNVPATTILPSGNVGIGTTNPAYKLSVNGTIGTKEVVVTATGWSDYVFQPDYRLQPLKEIAAYIKANHHLPEIPSEAEVKENGVSLGGMQAKLLAKIEELTLHMIQSEERNTRLEQENAKMQDRLARLEGRTAQ